MRNEHLLLPNLIAAQASHRGGGTAYSAARSAALARWRPYTGSANADTIYDLERLRAQSRDLSRNDPIATGAKLTAVTGSIGTGLSLQPKPDRNFLNLTDEDAEAWEESTRRRFNFWADSDACDYHRKHNLYGAQAVIRGSALDSGDCFVLLTRRALPDDDNQLCFQIIEADRVSNKDNAPDSDTLVGGIKYDTNGVQTHVQVCNRHPGEIAGSKTKEWTEIPIFGERTGRRNVIQVFAIEQTLRPGQARAVPWLAPVIQPLKQLGEFTDAELQSTVNAAIHSFFVEMEQEAFHATFGPASGLTETDKTAYLQSCIWNGEVNGGKAVRLLPGEKVHNVQASHPNAGLDPFMAAILKRVGAALGIPFEVLILSFNASYSAARASLLRAWQMFKLWRAGDASALCDPIYMAFLAEEIGLGRIRAPGFFLNRAYGMAWGNAHWVGDGPGSIDPQREVAAAKERVNLTISTLEAESEAYDGLPWADKANQRAKEQKILEGGGLVQPVGQPAQNQNAPVTMEALMQVVMELSAKVDMLTEAQA